MFASLGRSAVVLLILLFFAAGFGVAADDPYGEPDLVYIDAVEARAGEQVTVQVNLRNDETIGSISVPLTYDTSLLTLTALSFEGSRAEHWETRLISPEKAADIHGHFVAAVVRFSEAPIPAGDGLYFTATFTVNPNAEPGTQTVIDTLFYPPGGELILSENSVGTQIRPDFTPGVITIKVPNQAPTFVGLQDQYVYEGEQLVLDVAINDPNLDNVKLAATSKPTGASFVDNGDGTGRFVWTPGFVGPYSSDGSPFSVVFWAGDGQFSVEQSVALNVVNVNRAPKITAPEEVVVAAGESMSFSITATDADFEDLTWQVSSLQSNYQFTEGDPSTYTWQAPITDTSEYKVQFVVEDPDAAADTALVTVRVRTATLYSLVIDTVTADLGGEVDVDILLENLVPVTGFNILFGYDRTATSIIDVTNSGTRAADFDYFNVIYDEYSIPGNVRVVGIADQSSPINEVLAAGDGPIARLTFGVTGDLAFSGYQVPISFKYLGSQSNPDNVLTDTVGARIDTTQVYRANGAVTIRSIGTVKIGDINLNGIAYEISDVILFTNHFINPSQYPFTALQYANSDINNDQIVASLADLVRLINVVVYGGATTPKLLDEPAPQATLGSEQLTEYSNREFWYDCPVEIAAALITLEAPPSFDLNKIKADGHEMMMAAGQNGTTIRVLLYSLEGKRLPAGHHELFVVENAESITLIAAEMGTVDGRTAALSLNSSEPALPEEFTLYQNYPNPFNPETRIAFDLPVSGAVRLSVYNVLGQKVKVLFDGNLTAGSHQVTWNGTDQAGGSVSSGIYLYRLETESAALSRKMMLLK
ncbi:T9SS type A sorting domain-containing protein [bacterium]|nr:T9SS type A sorting domain-containing protein [bacterium]